MWGTGVSNSYHAVQWYICGHPDSLVPKCASIVLEIRLRRPFALPPFITQHSLFSYANKKPYQRPPNVPPIGWALYLVILIDQPKLACFCIYVWWQATVTICRHSQDIKSRLVIDTVKFWRVAWTAPPDKAKKWCVDRHKKVLRGPLRKEYCLDHCKKVLRWPLHT